jgi:hypothetical protein
MPNQIMNSGTRAANGIVRSICSGASITSSPRRDRPDSRPRLAPASPPAARPASTRSTEAHAACGSSPFWISAQSVVTAVAGDASTWESMTPDDDSACQAPTSSASPSRRGSSGGQ